MCENWQKILKFVLKFNVPRMSETFLKKKNHVRKTFQQGIKTWYKCCTKQMMWYWCRINRKMEQNTYSRKNSKLLTQVDL